MGDAIKYTLFTQRPFPSRVGGIDSWNYVLHFIAAASIYNNFGLLVVSVRVENYLPFLSEVEEHVPRWAVLVILEQEDVVMQVPSPSFYADDFMQVFLPVSYIAFFGMIVP